MLVSILICIALLFSQYFHRQLSPTAEVTPTTIMKDNASEDLLGFWSIMNRSYVEDHLVRPRVGDHVCEDVLCSEFLTQEDLRQVDRCAKRLHFGQEGQTLVPSCHFMNGASSQTAIVALISFPGSGNTWIRGLLEKATGICTGKD